MTQNYCSNCGEPLKEFAIVCSSCGTPIKQQETQTKNDQCREETETSKTERINAEMIYDKNTTGQRKSPFFALILSFFMTGLGQIYNGRFWKGIGFLIAVPLGFLFLIIPGVAIWVWCLYDAYTDAEKVNRGEMPYKEPSVWDIIFFLLVPFIIVFGLILLMVLYFIAIPSTIIMG
ncbi:MAG: zinc-ribbon domain-containing protein [Methanimicrococcus sp.]|nr:zinc-ribbon domain-containing protein [Methanimicrococcus sp.]